MEKTWIESIQAITKAVSQNFYLKNGDFLYIHLTIMSTTSIILKIKDVTFDDINYG